MRPVITVKTRGETAYHQNLQPEELAAWQKYDEAIYVDCSGQDWDRLPERLPPHLEILVCEKNRITSLPALPKTLRCLMAGSNRISVFPDVRGLRALESIGLAENDLREISLPQTREGASGLRQMDVSFNLLERVEIGAPWIEELVEVNLSYNRLTTLSSCFDALSANCRVDLRHNDFPSQRANAYVEWIGESETEDARILRQRLRRFGVPIRTRKLAGECHEMEVAVQAVEFVPRPMESIYENKQNVHLTSIQRSTDESLRWLKGQGSPHPSSGQRDAALRGIQRAWRAPWWRFWRWPKERLANRLIFEWSLEKTVHSRHGLMYGELLHHVWAAMETQRDEDAKKQMARVLMEEILDGRGVCFTGRFTRTVNALSGFFPEIRVGISDREQMQNRIVEAIKRAETTSAETSAETSADDLRQTVSAILDEFSVPECERDEWLDALPAKGVCT